MFCIATKMFVLFKPLFNVIIKARHVSAFDD